MKNNAGLPQNKTTSSIENAESDSSRDGFFGFKIDILSLGAGALFLLINLVVFCVNIRLNSLFFYLNMRHWSVFTSVVVWVIALWTVLEVTGIAKFCLPFFRMLAATCILLAIIFALNSYSIGNHSHSGYLLWFHIFAACCIVRSLFLVYEYRYGENDIDVEEAQWFWGMSGFFLVSLIVTGILSFVPVTTPLGNTFRTESLFEVYGDRLRELVQYGTGTFAMKMFTLLLAATTFAFVYVVGKWLLILYLKIRGDVK